MEKSERRIEAERKLQEAFDRRVREDSEYIDELLANPDKITGLDGDHEAEQAMRKRFYAERDAILLEYADVFVETE